MRARPLRTYFSLLVGLECSGINSCNKFVTRQNRGVMDDHCCVFSYFWSLSYFEFPIILKPNPFPLDLAFFFQPFTIAYIRLANFTFNYYFNLISVSLGLKSPDNVEHYW